MTVNVLLVFSVEPLNTPEEKSKEKTLNTLLKRLEDKRLQQGRPQEIQVRKSNKLNVVKVYQKGTAMWVKTSFELCL